MIRIGVLGPSEIAARRFLPAIKQSTRADFAGIACASPEERGGKTPDEYLVSRQARCRELAEENGGVPFDSFAALLDSGEVDAVYIPLPPALHEKWALEAIGRGIHVLLEKPSSTSLASTTHVVEAAAAAGLAVRENYAFAYHAQIEMIRDLIGSGEIGEVRLIRSAFGFPYRGDGDFRYHRSQGGGALLDCGGYPVKLAAMLLGGEAVVKTASLDSSRGHDVEVFGSATLANEFGMTAQVAFGMDNAYRCELEVWGSEKSLIARRVFTPVPTVPCILELVDSRQNVQTVEVPADDQFLGSIDDFVECIGDHAVRAAAYEGLLDQARLVEQIAEKASWQL